MKFAPRRAQIIGRMVMKKTDMKIILTDETTKVTKFVLVDAVGEEAAAAGIKVGDIVVPNTIGTIVLSDRSNRPFLKEEHVAFFVRDVTLSDLLVQTDIGKNYVPFDHADAAKSVAAAPEGAKSAAA